MDDDAPCHVCKKLVYNSDVKKALGHRYHRWCFRCTKCNATLTLGKERAHEDQAFCERCHQSLFGAQGFRGAGSSIDAHERSTAVHTPVATPQSAVPLHIPAQQPASVGAAGAGGAQKFCSSCGTAASGAARFCASCGSQM
eukprot:TRINITY_DN7800_c0_g1_i1.p2 TRINITY_DN7800_c0_g1~~TRINITY_DN7800_c0_g1_i1.p2  ORF type:complete len:155 (-),score=18.88 TRINITY_DN7800_c0_g1_i1:55-477(-)